MSMLITKTMDYKLKKASYQRRIWTYRKRRESCKERQRLLTKKISQWENEVRRIESKQERLEKIVKAVNKYFDVDIMLRTNKGDYALARNIYYKLAIESKLQGKIVGEFIGRSKKIAGECRLNFQRSFKIIHKHKEAYHKFKKYYEN